jgi:glycosyltransferase involved in cell wall biosynthesis
MGTFEKYSGHLVPVNSHLAKALRQTFPAATMTVLPNYIETSHYQERTDFEARFVYLGRLSEEKGILTLLTALQATPQAKLDIVGDGPQRSQLEAYARDHLAPDQAHFYGFISGSERFEILRRATAMIVPSVWHEPCPVSVLEAMALGVPVVATRQGGLPDLVVDGKTGLLFNAGDASQLGRCLERLASSPDTVRQLGRSAREHALTEFDVEVHYQRLMGVYAAAIAANG